MPLERIYPMPSLNMVATTELSQLCNVSMILPGNVTVMGLRQWQEF